MINKNLFCNQKDLINESSVEIFFVNRLISFLGFNDSDIKTKVAIDTLDIGKGSRKEKYKPDYICFIDGKPSLLIDAKSPDEKIEEYLYQISGYALSINQKFKGENPVQYIMLTNGIKTDLYKWDDDHQILKMEFKDFDKDNDKFKSLKNYISHEALIVQNMPVADNFEFNKPSIDLIKSIFSKAHDIIWKKEKIAPTDAFYEFSKIIFIKINQDRRIRKIRKEKGILKKDDFIFSIHWIEDQEKFEPNPFNVTLFYKVRNDLEEEIKEKNKKRIFEENEQLNLKPLTIKEVVKLLEHLDLYGIDEDLNGRMFETFLNATVRGKDLGQFFTPRGVVKFMVKMADIKVSQKKIDTVIDIFCGSGGFLIEAMADMIVKVKQMSSITNDEKEQMERKIKQGFIFGIDANPKIAKVARMNMYLHGDGGSRIYQADSLDKNINLENGMKLELEKELKELKKYLLEEKIKFTVALSNPPFSMKYEIKKPDEKEMLKEYEIAENETAIKSNVLSLERYYDLLDDSEGRLLTVIDDTVLNGVNSKKFRDFIREKFIIKAIISLPFNTFKNAQTTVKTSILYLRKKGLKEIQSAIFMAICNNVGHSDFGTDTPERNNLSHVLSFYRDFIDIGNIKTEIIDSNLQGEMLSCPLQIFVVQPEQLKERLDAFYYSPELKKFQNTLSKLNNIDLKNGKDFILVSDLKKSEYLKQQDDVFKYLEVGDVNNRGDLVGFQENQLKNLPTRARKLVKEGDVIIAKNISSLGSIAIIGKSFDNQLVSTGFIVIRPRNQLEGHLAWSILKSKVVEKQMYYLSATAVQPEVSEEIFKTEVFIPIPKRKDEQQRIFNVVKDIEQKRQSANIAIDTQDNSLLEYLGITNLK